MSAVPPPPLPRKFVSKVAQPPSPAASGTTNTNIIVSAPGVAAVGGLAHENEVPARSSAALPMRPTPAAPTTHVTTAAAAAAAPSTNIMPPLPPAGWGTTTKASDLASPTSIMKRRSPALGPSPAQPLTFAPASLASPFVGGAGSGGSLSPTAQSEQLLKQQLMIEELVRENRNLQGRVARWLQSTEPELADDAERQRLAQKSRRSAAAAAHRERFEGSDAGDSEQPPASASSPTIAAGAGGGTHDAGTGNGNSNNAKDFSTVVVGSLGEALDEKSSPALLLARIRRLELALQLEAMERDDAETKVHVHQRMIAYLLKRLHQPQP